VEELKKIVNPYEYIFSKVTGSKFSVSKIKPFSNVFYDFLEISQTLNMFDTYLDANILSLHFGMHRNSTIECMNIIREENNDLNLGFENLEEYNNAIVSGTNNIHFLYYENSSNKNVTLDLVKFIVLLLQKQKSGGFCIIKIDNLFYKPMVDVLYLLSSFYEKMYVIKPNTSLLTNFEKYVVCKYFTSDFERIKLYYENLEHFLEKFCDHSLKISNIVKDEIPYYFINKIEEANIIVGHQQLESLDQVVNILKNKNREDKIESLKKNNLQKCIHWCEKYKIPYNKFTEKVNIFLPFLKQGEEKNEILDENQLSEFIEEELDNDVIIEIFEQNNKFDYRLA
jgi:hypothetical protein